MTPIRWLACSGVVLTVVLVVVAVQLAYRTEHAASTSPPAFFDVHTASGLITSETTLPDGDADGIHDPADNCVAKYNPTQTDADLDGAGDACDDSDTDGDGFSDRLEHAVGTDAASPCPASSSHSAWPPDLNNDGVSDTYDITQLTQRFNHAVPPESPRYDIHPSGFVDTGDISRMTNVFGLSCPPG